ncbi:unnamed protein product, partial [Discosporangium mesarthrocarpum]
RPCAILTLGDGNFSFSIAMARSLLQPGDTRTQSDEQPLPAHRPARSYAIVATSFDGREDLVTKYPESEGIVRKLKKMGVSVRHNVDATAIGESETNNNGTMAEGELVSRLPGPFHHIIFNHPHTGTEDVRRHRSLLGHFFFAARRDNVLAPQGIVHVTLASDQPERWRLREQAARHGFVLVSRCPFPGTKLDGFMTKRHQTGRSFRCRRLESQTLSFGKGKHQDGYERGEVGLKVKWPVFSTAPPWLWTRTNSDSDQHHQKEVSRLASDNHLEETCGGRGTGALEGANETGARGPVKGKKRYRGSSDSRQSLGRRIGRKGEEDGPATCQLCGVQYKSGQALRTHTRQVHELGVQIGVADRVKADLPCPQCDRVFISEAAMAQHQAAKHKGPFIDIKPDWCTDSIYLEGPIDPSPGETGVVTMNGRGLDDRVKDAMSEDVSSDGKRSPLIPKLSCEICGYHFTSEGNMRKHLSNLRPPPQGGGAASNVIRCGGCSRKFGERRAMLQHANFC